MNALDLFSGTGSWKKVLKDLNYNVVSVDITDYKGKFNITHKEDILTWNYKQYPNDYFKIVTAGCPCIWYSILQKTWIGRHKVNKTTKQKYLYTEELYKKDLEYSDKLVKKTLEIIDYFKIGNPDLIWYIENPYTSLLKTRPFMKDKPFYVVDYCSYGFYYKKRTIIFTNKKGFKPKLCQKDKCHAIIKFNDENNKVRILHKSNCGNSKRKKLVKKHYRTLGSWGDGEVQKGIGGGNNRLERYRVPYSLIKGLLS
tara:strand:- start:30 stop:794 length:765 start_codon:yes stop_codon:yes gene_type:complete